jgi:SAM-dependent MidA family methyltransferase
VTLREKIEQDIRRNGPIPFSRYMELCLYDPEFGYYSRNAEHFGKSGDFYTSSDVHAVFGRLLARQFDEIWRALGSSERIEILELGPGRGLFAQDLLDWSGKKFPEFFRALRYSLVESSPALRKQIASTLARHVDNGKARVITTIEPRASSPTEGPSPTIIFANEFFDAFPVDVLSTQGQLAVNLENGKLSEIWTPASSEQLAYLDRYSVHPEPGERLEVPLPAMEYMAKAAASLQRGFLIAIDYGYTRQEQLAGRHRDTVMAYRQHSASANPYEAPGEQDITAHVNFTALAAAAEQGGMQVYPLLTQSQFLMGIGEGNQFADAFEDCRLPQERAKVALQLKHLVTPVGMGETFHVLVASKGVNPEQVETLTGLSFGKSRL